MQLPSPKKVYYTERSLRNITQGKHRWSSIFGCLTPPGKDAMFKIQVPVFFQIMDKAESKKEAAPKEYGA